MTIVADSSQWTGEHDDDAAPAGPVVWGEFDDRETLDRAAGRLREEAWFREANARTEAAGEAGRADNDQIHAEILGARGSAFRKTAPCGCVFQKFALPRPPLARFGRVREGRCEPGRGGNCRRKVAFPVVAWGTPT